jgi:hypothetical protein
VSDAKSADSCFHRLLLADAGWCEDSSKAQAPATGSFLGTARRLLPDVWLWDSEAEWDAAFPRFGPSLPEYVVPNLAQPPDRVGSDVVVEATP